MTGISSSDTQKLIRCSVSNKEGFTSSRFVEFEFFKLWHYTMYHKHGITVSDISLCLWVSEDDYKPKKDIYMRFGETESVNKIVISIFDRWNCFSHTSARYVSEQEAAKVREILLSHIPVDIAQSDSLGIHTYPGKSIVNTRISRLDEIVLGLARFGGEETDGLGSEIVPLEKRVIGQEALRQSIVPFGPFVMDSIEEIKKSISNLRPG